MNAIASFGRRLLKALLANYEFWRIYTLDLTCVREFIAPLRITDITDPAIFEAADVAQELRRANCYRPGAIGYAAWRGSELLGVCWFWPGPLLGERSVGLQAGDCAEVIQISVAPSVRGQGVAPALLNHAAWQLKGQGFRRLYAQIWRTNVASMRSFEKSGWIHVAWFFQVSPRRIFKPIRYRRILRGFRTDRAILRNWPSNPLSY
jgi:GNAT superfamily N-acetyltransferase